jgi:hypothetical protein
MVVMVKMVVIVRRTLTGSGEGREGTDTAESSQRKYAGCISPVI